LISVLEVRSADEVERAFATATREGVGALMVFRDFLTGTLRAQIIHLAATSRLPVMSEEREFVDAGGLLSYGPSLADLTRRAATYVDKILKGTKPADLPVEQPIKFELVVNLKTAQALGLTLSPGLLFQADEVIK